MIAPLCILGVFLVSTRFRRTYALRSPAVVKTANSAAVWRRTSGLKQAEAALQLDLPRYLLSNIETGTVTPAWEIAVKMSRLYSCGVNDLFPGVVWQGVGAAEEDDAYRGYD